MEGDNDFKGTISEWNEGNFKNLRLHEAQEWINSGKVAPFSLTEDKMKLNYQVWKSGIDILYGEGKSKYSKEEIDEVESVKSFTELIIENKQPFTKRTAHTAEGKKDKLIPIPENQMKIRELLENYESIVKKYNDVHGLSTRNVDEDDTKGL